MRKYARFYKRFKVENGIPSLKIKNVLFKKKRLFFYHNLFDEFV